MAKTSISVLSALLLISCGCHNLRSDVVMPATDANYASAEFYACDDHWNGVGICSIESGKDLKDLNIQVQGYSEGTIRFATDCKTTTPPLDSARYTDSQKIAFNLEGKAEESCGVSFVVSPEYPQEQKQKFKIESFEGHIWIRVLKPGLAWKGRVDKVPESGNVSNFKLLSSDLQSEVIFNSDLCKVNFRKILPIVNGVLLIPLTEVMPDVSRKKCVLNGAAIMTSGVTRLSWFVDVYNTQFIPLPVPSLTYKLNRIFVRGDDNVSIISLDGEVKINNTASFRFDDSVAHVLRMLTINGRSIIGDYKPTKGWQWIY